MILNINNSNNLNAVISDKVILKMPLINKTPYSHVRKSTEYGTIHHERSNIFIQKSFFRYCKLIFLICCWATFTLLLMIKNEKHSVMHMLSVSSSQVHKFVIAEQLISNQVSLELEGPFISPTQTDHTNANLSSSSLTIWLELIEKDKMNNMDNTSAQILSTPWIISISSPELNLTSVQKQQKTFDVNYSLNNQTNITISVNLKTNLQKSFPVSIIYDLSPINQNDGIFYGTIVLIGLYILIIFDVIHRAFAAIIASTMSLGILALCNQRPTTTEIVSWIDIDTILLLFSMMILVALFGETGIFDYLAVIAYKITGGKMWPLIFILCFFTAIMSSFLDNTTMVLLMTPVTIRLCEVMEINPVPILITTVISSNIGGTLTPVGDPPNVIITSNYNVINAGINFNTFLLHMSMGVILAFLVACVQLRFYFRDPKDLGYDEPQDVQELRHEIAIWQRAASSLSNYSREEKLVREILLKKVQRLYTSLSNKLTNHHGQIAKYKMTLEELQERYPIRDKWLLVKCSLALMFIITLFFLHHLPYVNLSLGWTTLLGVFLLLISADTKDFDGILARVEWSTLIFFAALFILMEALSRMGLIAWIGKQTEWVILSVNEESRLATAILLVLWVSALASALVDNVPLTTMMIRLVINLSKNDELGLPLQPLVWALAFGACMGGNATLIGASANVVCAGVAEQHGYRFTFMQYFKVGFPVMLSTISVVSIYLIIAHVIFQWH
ncbi:P protein isoform X2 [Chelonus insularis]|uniref:P protein isoform X2 n=1 Tax=Chelonus insularis TaxID=460826 RepID=UPI00158F391A|nr:P protein isoform X2 [Chelonus insularis]